LGRAGELDQLEHLVDAVERDARCERERAQVIATAAGGMEVGRLEHCADLAERLVELAVTTTEDQRLSGCWLRQPEYQSEGRRLAGTVWTKKAGDGPSLEQERHVVECGDLSVALGQPSTADNLRTGIRLGLGQRESRPGLRLAGRFRL